MTNYPVTIMSRFRLLSQKPLHLPSTITSVNTYQHPSGFQVVFVKVPGPLVSASIVVPTHARDDKGLAHTLEHLIFCGSQRYERGYLDYLATRGLSTGTNGMHLCCRRSFLSVCFYLYSIYLLLFCYFLYSFNSLSLVSLVVVLSMTLRSFRTLTRDTLTRESVFTRYRSTLTRKLSPFTTFIPSR